MRHPDNAKSTRRSLTRATLSALLVLGVAGAAQAGDPPADPLTEKQVSKAFSKDARLALRQIKKGTRDAVKVLGADLKTIEQALAAEELDLPEFTDELLGALEGFVMTLTGQTFTHVFGLDTSARETLELAPDVSALPEACQIGAFGAADKVATAVDKLVVKAERKARRLVKTFRKNVAEDHGLAVNVMLNPTRHTQPLAPVLGEDGVPPVNFPFALEVLIGVSDPSVDDDGLLGFALLAPGNMGDELASILIGVDVFEFGGPWTIDGGGRTRGVLGGGEDGLPETSYKLVLDRFGTQVSRSITVP